MMKLIGPFKQILSLNNLPLKGALKDHQLEIIENGAILVQKGEILKVADFEALRNEFPEAEVEEIEHKMVLIPGFVDCHTHTCFAGSRAMDFAERNAGTPYLEIAQKGGGIWSTVTATRNASQAELKTLTENRVNSFLKNGITTIEIKSGYGLSVEEEIKILNTINQLNTKAQVVSTCLSAHIKPRDFEGSSFEYLEHLIDNLLPKIKHLTNRIDIFTEKSAFDIEESIHYLQKVKEMGFQMTVHAVRQARYRVLCRLRQELSELG